MFIFKPPNPFRLKTKTKPEPKRKSKKWPNAQISCGKTKGPLETWARLTGTRVLRGESFDAVGPAAAAWEQVRGEVEALFRPENLPETLRQKLDHGYGHGRDCRDRGGDGNGNGKGNGKRRAGKDKDDTVQVAFRMVGTDKASAVPALLVFCADAKRAQRYKDFVRSTAVWQGFVARYPAVRVLCCCK